MRTLIFLHIFSFFRSLLFLSVPVFYIEENRVRVVLKYKTSLPKKSEIAVLKIQYLKREI